MKYNKSDFAKNKNSKNIVYNFADATQDEISLEKFLLENPHLTSGDFEEWKAFSDENYHNTDKNDTKHNKKKISLDSFDYEPTIIKTSAEEQFFEQEHKTQESPIRSELLKYENFTLTEEQSNNLRIVNELLKGKRLTKKQQDRFIKYYVLGLTMRKIAIMEEVEASTISRSFKLIEKKLAKYKKTVR
ncbi:MAG: hypothetical protein R3Y09_10080 [Clostridia bacterium]